MDKSIEKFVKERESESLSANDVMYLCNGKANLLTYDKLKDFDTIDEVLGPHSACIILYLSKENYGHWTCVFKLNKNTLEFFDPMGILIDDELKYINKQFRKRSNQNKKYLTRLILDSHYKITYNDKKLQQYSKSISTCGRWVCIRLILRDIPLKRFVYLFTHNKYYSPDFLITLLTSLV